MSESEEDLKKLNETAMKALDEISEADKAAELAALSDNADAEANAADIPKNIHSLIDRLDDMMNKMSALITNENSLLRSRDYKAVAKNAHQKNEYMRTYEVLLKEFMNKKDLLKNEIPEETKNELIAKAEKLQLSLKKNHFFLQSVHISAKRVAERITKAIQNKLIDENATYNNKGLLNGGKDKNGSAVTDGAF